MDQETLRLLVFQVLKEDPDTQMGSIFRLAAGKARQQGLLDRNREELEQKDQNIIYEIVWSLIIQGIIIPGRSTQGWPFITVTEYGRKVLDAGEIIPHDPDGYLEHVKSILKPHDDIILMYLSEGLQCFLRGTYLASTVMLGVASERAFLNLQESFIKFLPAGEAKKLKQFLSKPISTQFTEFWKRLEPKIPLLPNNEDLEIQLRGIYTLIRNARNDVGHPTGKNLTEMKFSISLECWCITCEQSMISNYISIITPIHILQALDKSV